MKFLSVMTILTITAQGLLADVKKGEEVFKMYCAACHGPEGAGLVGPNLTDKEILHGEKIEDIIKVVKEGIADKGMPAWSSILKDDEVNSVAEFVKSIMGKNLPPPFIEAKSTVTPLPKGTLTRPLLMRTFMPTEELDDEVFMHHGKGEGVPKYSHKTGKEDPQKLDKPIQGIPAAIAVNFGDQLSYCFDSTECRLLYTWSGGFVDQSNYWGPGSGGSRKSFGYVGTLVGKKGYITKGKAPLSGEPKFKGYRKVNSIPEFIYSIDTINFTLKITPSTVAGVAICEYTSDASSTLTLNFSQEEAAQFSVDKGILKDGQLILSSAEAKKFTITINPKK